MGLKKLRVYLENSAIGGYYDDEFMVTTQKLFDLFIDGTYMAVISTHVINELLKGAPERVLNLLKIIKYEEYQITEEMLKLKDKYMQQKIVSEQFEDDALYVAIATVIDVDILISWNCRHIVNLNKIRLFNAVNISEGYKALEIRTPEEVI